MVEDFAGFLAGAGVELVKVLARGIEVLHVLGEVLQGDVEVGAIGEQQLVAGVEDAARGGEDGDIADGVVRVRHGQDGELAVAEVELVAVLHGDDGVVAREVDALEAVVGHGGVGDALFRHEGGVEVGVVGRVVEVVVGVDDVLDGLVGQGLGVFADVAGAVAAVDHDGELVAREQVAVVAVVLDLPGVGCDLLGGEVGLVHRDLAAVGVLDHGIVLGGEVDGSDGRPDGGGVDLCDAVLDVEGAAGADARRDLAAGLFGEGARLIGAGEGGCFFGVFCGEQRCLGLIQYWGRCA